MPTSIRTAVFPVAGRGTRFLPATKAVPKEMLPIVDKPLIQFAVEEALEAGVTRLVFITHSSKRAIEDHFDVDSDLDRALEASGKKEMLKKVREILPKDVSCVFIRQGEPLGLGHAVLCARPAVGNEPFFVHLPDDLIRGEVGCLSQMAKQFEINASSVVAVENVPQDKTGSYGIVAVDHADHMKAIVEKPNPAEAPSTLAVVGRYLLTPKIFDLLETTGRGAGGEIQLTDAIADLLGHESVQAYRFEGTRYDCGSKLGYVRATIDAARVDPEIVSSLQGESLL
ncbi:MAG TPA: UTP--glucose-1-phosphate uridylyltransferase GalU [Gammaproteobacteria bacterium]|jgi:UTP--glucose-1-phosphate uridylyltransferase|nr:UTP--glucose-1-phosphate uridylyltransferase GalU [Gammaproteobacteria bacterium]HJP39958.1 UTP--glucose-1-phosphate uridylyltransferase GalU [Gammaproteobacteria bacterium]